MKLISALITIPAAIVCFVAGLVVGDLAQLTGFPARAYELQLKYDGTPKATFICTRLGDLLGGNLSGRDSSEVMGQNECRVRALGATRPDGSFIAIPGAILLKNRIFQHDELVVPAEMIEKIRPLKPYGLAQYLF